MKIIKRLIICLSSTILLLWIWLCQEFPDPSNSYFPYSWTTLPIPNSPVNIDIPNIITGTIEDSDNGLNKLLNVFMPNSSMYDDGSWPSILFYLKTIVNLLLSFVSLIALILIIYAFYMIFFKKDEAGTTMARQIIKWVVIALFVIWLSRIVVSFLYRFQNENTKNLWYKNSNTEITNNLT